MINNGLGLYLVDILSSLDYFCKIAVIILGSALIIFFSLVMATYTEERQKCERINVNPKVIDKKCFEAAHGYISIFLKILIAVIAISIVRILIPSKEVLEFIFTSI